MFLTQLKNFPENLTVFNLELALGSCTMAGHPGFGRGRPLVMRGEPQGGSGGALWLLFALHHGSSQCPQKFSLLLQSWDNLAAPTDTGKNTSHIGRPQKGAEWSFRER